MGTHPVEIALRRWFEDVTPAIVQTLQGILAKPLPAGTGAFDFELHYGHWTEFPIVGYPMSRDGDQHGVWFLSDSIRGMPQSLVDQLETAPDDTRDALIPGAIFSWFADCWHAAGGPAKGMPAYVCNHDDIESFDINARKRIDDKDKWS